MSDDPDGSQMAGDQPTMSDPGARAPSVAASNIPSTGVRTPSLWSTVAVAVAIGMLAAALAGLVLVLARTDGRGGRDEIAEERQGPRDTPDTTTGFRAATESSSAAANTTDEPPVTLGTRSSSTTSASVPVPDDSPTEPTSASSVATIAAPAPAATRFVGTWTGAARQAGAQPYSVRLDLASPDGNTVQGTVAYPELNCTGLVSYERLSGDTLVM
ncbi:MAG: hypothetical protein R2754_17725, partial [Microthrixaceae bacterium]